jgi:hypothetical protein
MRRDDLKAWAAVALEARKMSITRWRIAAALWCAALLAVGAQAQGPSRGSLGAASAVHQLDVQGMATASITVSGTYSGTVSFEVVPPLGAAAVTVDCATPAAPGTAINSTTGTGTWVCPVAGMSLLQARMSSYTSGAADVVMLASASAGQTVAAAGGGGSFDGVLLDAAGGDALTDTVNNALRVNIIAGAGSGGTAMTDDAAFTPGTTSVTPAGAVFDDVTPDSVNEGDGGAVRMSANRNLYSTIRDASGSERGANVTAGNALVVDGSAVTQPVSATNLDVQIGGSDTVTVTGSLSNDGSAASTNRIGTLPAVVQNSAPTLTDGRNAALSLTTGGAARVIVTNAAGAAQTLASDVAEDGAHSDGETGPLVLTRRIDTASSSAGTSGDRATFNTDALGRLWTRPGNPCQDHARVTSVAIDTSTSGNVQLVALNGSDLIYICGYSVVVGSTATAVQLIYGTGTACATGETDLTGPWPFAANGGITQANAGSPQFVVPAGNALCVELSAANPITGHVTYVRTAAP